jgi:hypothetical protein
VTEHAGHPGFIVFVDGDTGVEVRRVEASTMPESACFEDTPNGRVPIVKIVAHTGGNERHLLAYGPNGELLRSIVQIAGP